MSAWDENEADSTTALVRQPAPLPGNDLPLVASQASALPDHRPSGTHDQ